MILTLNLTVSSGRVWRRGTPRGPSCVSFSPVRSLRLRCPPPVSALLPAGTPAPGGCRCLFPSLLQALVYLLRLQQYLPEGPGLQLAIKAAVCAVSPAAPRNLQHTPTPIVVACRPRPRDCLALTGFGGRTANPPRPMVEKPLCQAFRIHPIYRPPPYLSPKKRYRPKHRKIGRNTAEKPLRQGNPQWGSPQNCFADFSLACWNFVRQLGRRAGHLPVVHSFWILCMEGRGV